MKYLVALATAEGAKKSCSSSCSSSSNKLIVVFAFGLDFGSAVDCDLATGAAKSPPPSSPSSSLNSPPPELDLLG